MAVGAEGAHINTVPWGSRSPHSSVASPGTWLALSNLAIPVIPKGDGRGAHQSVWSIPKKFTFGG